MRTMRNMKMSSLIIAVCLYQGAIGQQKNQVTEKDHIIPFQLTKYNNLSVQAVLNNKDTVNLMFHTAASSLTLTEEATKKITSLKFEGTDTVKSWGGADNESRFSKSNTLQIGDLSWENIAIWENKNSGPLTDGKFGPDLFENKVVEIDFDKKVIIVHAALPAKAKKYEKLKLTHESDLLFVEAECSIDKSTYKNKFLLHSGYSGAILVDDKFAAETKMGDQLKIVDVKELKDSYGNVLKTKKAILPAFRIGNEKLTNTSVGFFEGAIGRQKISIIGGDILKRFNIIIDAQREYIYLKTNSLKNTAYSNV
ncbi:MAG: aspartyl protease family protein [Chitinophagaceae bacterium]